MSMVATRRQGSAVIPKMKLCFGVAQGVYIEAESIEISRQIIGRHKIDGGSVTRFSADFQQALDHFQRGKASNRISVGCHV